MPMAHGDARRVSQVLLNLVGNAIKFTDAGRSRDYRLGLRTVNLCLTVRDTGPGIADADQERIFGEFQQIDNSNTRKKGGTGLGLAISKRMVEIQGGMISVEFDPGTGIDIPRRLAGPCRAGIGGGGRMSADERRLSVRSEMKPVISVGYRRPRESAGPEPALREQGAANWVLVALGSRFRGNDD